MEVRVAPDADIQKRISELAVRIRTRAQEQHLPSYTRTKAYAWEAATNIVTGAGPVPRWLEDFK